MKRGHSVHSVTGQAAAERNGFCSPTTLLSFIVRPHPDLDDEMTLGVRAFVALLLGRVEQLEVEVADLNPTTIFVCDLFFSVKKFVSR